jgi:amidohydrolase
VGREVDPLETAVISTGKMEAGSAFNIIPERVSLLGTTRTFRPEIQDNVEKSIGRIIDGICHAFQCTAEYKYTRYVPSTINDKEATLLLKDLGEEVFGAENVEEAPPVMGSEDFSYYQRVVPGTFFFLGGGNAEKGTDRPHHSPTFNVDEDAFANGVAMLAGFAWKYMVSKAE